MIQNSQRKFSKATIIIIIILIIAAVVFELMIIYDFYKTWPFKYFMEKEPIPGGWINESCIERCKEKYEVGTEELKGCQSKCIIFHD